MIMYLQPPVYTDFLIHLIRISALILNISMNIILQSLISITTELLLKVELNVWAKIKI